jgi:hypothetical protein
MSRKKRDASPQGWPKAAIVISLALTATAQVGHVVTVPTQRPATTCISLRA